MTSEVLRRDFLPNHKNWRLFETGRAFSVGSLEIESFSVPHDAVDPVGYVIRDGSGALGVLTDMGYATKMAIERVREAHTVLIETNHDEQMLQADTKRPWSVKQRILSRHGHLSNDAAGAVARELMGSGNIQRFVLGHLSRDCNSSELAIEAVARALGFNPAELPEGFEIFCASQGERSPTFSVTNSVQPKQAPTDVQTRLF